MREILKNLLNYWIEILIGILILFNLDDIRWFLLYSFAVILITMFRDIDYLRKLIRISQFSNQIKITAIIRKLKITDDEISIITDDEKNKMGKEKWEELEKEIKSLLG